MSFVFKAFTKSRRKKNKGRHPHGGDIGRIVPSIDDSEQLSINESALSRKDRPRHLVPSQTDEEDDDNTHPLNDQSPSHCSSSSAAAHVTFNDVSFPANSELNKGPQNSRVNRSLGQSINTPRRNDTSRRSLFRSLRRRSDLVSSHERSSKTPETTAGSTSSTPITSGDKVPTVLRGQQNKFSEIYNPSEQVSRRLTFQEYDIADQEKEQAPTNRKEALASLGGISNVGNRSFVLKSGRNSLELKRGRRNDANGSQTRSSGYAFGNKLSTTKTMVMNGDILVCPSHGGGGPSDTASTISAASSKAQALRREAERNARAASALDNKGNELFEMGHFDKAMSCYSKALKLKRRTFTHLLEEADDIEEQLMMCEEDKADPQILVSMATSINNIGYLRQRSGDATPEETMAAYEKSLRIKRRVLGNDSLSVGKTLNNIGSVHYLKREFDLALPAYEEALHIMKANLGERHHDVATVMSNIGDVHLGKGNSELSLLKYRQALTIRWETFGEKDPRVIRLLEKIAKVEIGDRMMAAKAWKNQALHSWDDDEASEMLESGMRSIRDELHQLQEQVAKDIDYVNSMERQATVEMLKDKIIIIRGMRAIWEGSGPELLDNDTASVKTGRSYMSQSRN